MKDPTRIRRNHTGIASAPERAAETVQGTEEFGPTPRLEGLALEQDRGMYILASEPAGTMPPPAGLKEIARSVLDTLQGKNPAVLLDALGARLAFERSGVRIYEALLTKVRAFGPQPGGPSAADLSEIWNDELSHFQILQDAVERMGGDPTAVTPCANLEAVASIGPIQIATDPRLNLRESMRAALLIELADNDSWESLIRLAGSFGQTELVDTFSACLASEQQHLARVRTWVNAMAEELAGGDVEDEVEEPAAAPDTDEAPPISHAA
jgi:hypothetical protein